MFELVIVIPVFQQGKALQHTVQRLADFGLPLIVINDGSDAAESRLLSAACQSPRITLLARASNGGKGAAVLDGLYEARRQGYSHAFQIDADGQHDLCRLPEFIEAAKRHPHALVLGYSCYDDSVPLLRKFGRWLTHFWTWINTLSFAIRDSMCGFRIYPIGSILKLVNAANLGQRMEFDTEICVRAGWQGLKIVNLPVAVRYPVNGKSNFRLVHDNVLISLMHARLFCGMLLRLAAILRLRRRGIIRAKADN